MPILLCWKKYLKDTRIIYENGLAEKLDVDKVSVQLTNLQTEKRKSTEYYITMVIMD